MFAAPFPINAKSGSASVNPLLGSVTTNGPVNGSAFDSGTGILYFVGGFSTATDSSGTYTRVGGAAVNVNTGLLTAWNPDLSGAGTNGWDVKVDGSGVYITWDGTGINGGTSRQGIAKVDKTNGTIVAAFDTGYLSAQFSGIDISGSSLYASGGNGVVNYIRKFNKTTGAEDLTFTAGLPTFSLTHSGYSVLLDGASVILTGSFTSPQRGVIKLNASTGAQQTYDPQMNGGVSPRVWPCIKSTDYFFGGNYTLSDVGTTRKGASSSTTASTPVLQPWDPFGSSASSIFCLLEDAAGIFMGGQWNDMASGATLQQTFSKVDKTTGAVVPGFNAAFIFSGGPYVRTICATLPGLIFAGGSYDVSYGGAATVGGKARYNMAFMDSTTGAVV